MLLTLLFVLACKTGTGPDSDSPEPALTPVDLAWDDGEWDRLSSPWEDAAGGRLAVHFITDGPAKLDGASFYVGDGGQPTTTFGVQVLAWDPDDPHPGEPLSETILEAAAEGPDTWVDVDLSSLDLGVDGDFALAMVWLTPASSQGADAQFLGVDIDGEAGHTYWSFTTMPRWRGYAMVSGQPGDAMIRARVLVEP